MNANDQDAKDAEDWKCELSVNGDRLEQFLAESPVLALIQRAGEQLLRVRRLVQELDAQKEDDDDSAILMSEELADELCQAVSSCVRTPGIRFFNGAVLANSICLEAVKLRGPKIYEDLPWTDAQYHAVVTYCAYLMAMMVFTSSADERNRDSFIEGMEACKKARPNDATIYVMYGNWLMMNGFTQDAVENLEKAVQLDKDTCFGAYYTLANIHRNAVNVQKANQSGPIERLQAERWMNQCVDYLRAYLDLAPRGHWHVHRACILLVLCNAIIKAKGTESSVSIEARHPGFCAESQANFRRGVEALKLYENCFGEEESDFKHQYKQAAGMIMDMQEKGLSDGIDQPIVSQYICANPTCTKSQSVEDKGNSRLKKCARCEVAKYCSKGCQTTHWKAGHKKECKKLAAERKARKQANPEKLRRPQVDTPQVGDKPWYECL